MKISCSRFDLGRSRLDSSVLIFKKNFNAQTEMLYYYNFTVGDSVVPERNSDTPVFIFLLSMAVNGPLLGNYIVHRYVMRFLWYQLK